MPTATTDRATMQHLVSVVIILRLDFCNSTFYGLPAFALEPFQHILHAAVRLVMGLGLRDHLPVYVKELRWLLIVYHKV